ncbi:MAG: ABC transporter ATP-binding protein [Desulfuromonadaceae bacterium GWC2_58_13]|nr:MAG: ABC transporter ATP-binding protein [Desulfuromonadaceae bacterium GWC2_58_13]
MTMPFLEVANVTKAFGHFVALRRISLTVREGRTTALIGPNGAGKTTFYNLLSGRLQPSEGTVHFCGRPVSGQPPHKINKMGISRSFQITNIFSELTVLENVLVALIAHLNLGLRFWRIVNRDKKLAARGMEVLERLGLGPLASSRAGTLSYGDKRLLELAIVLATEPKLVLLDEPTAGMTPEETHAVIRLLRSLAAEGKYTFLITEHDMNVVFGLADHIFVFHHGELLAEGTCEEIRAHPEVRAAYLGEEVD